MTLLVTGATGLLGQAIIGKCAKRGMSVVGLARSDAELECDLTDYASIALCFDRVRPSAVINAAANVDHANCEAEYGRAYAVNARAVSFLAELCQRSGAYLVQISTDHYYCGDGKRLHDENAPITLLNEYARTKYAGEMFALANPTACVVRTNVVGFRGWEKPTFVEWVIRSLTNGERITAFDDYFTSSLDADTLAESLLKLLSVKPRGVLNIASNEVSSKEQFIRALTSHLNLDAGLISTGRMKDSGLLPGRGDSLGLDVSKAEKLLSIKLPALSEVVANLATAYRRNAT